MGNNTARAVESVITPWKGADGDGEGVETHVRHEDNGRHEQNS